VKIYNARLATRLSASVDARLRQLALIRRQRINRLLDDLLDAALPPAAALTAQLSGLGQEHDQAGDGDDQPRS
jgi:hypothetical protein